MKNKIIIILGVLSLSVITSFIMQFFVWPRFSTSPFFVKYQLLKEENGKTIIINKTEKITVKENFSLTKAAEKVTPAIVRIYFVPKDNIVSKKIELNVPTSTGVILAGDGVIATVLPEFNLENKKIKVFLADSREFTAVVKHKDTFSDLLILKIEADNLPVAPFGEDDNLNNGEKLVLIGQTVFDDKPIFALRTIQERNKNFNRKGAKFLFSDKSSDVFALDNKLDEQFIGGAAVDFNGTIVGLINNVKNINGENSFVIPFEDVKISVEDAFAKNINKSYVFGVYYLNINKTLKILNNLAIDQGALVYNPSEKNGLAVLANSVGKELGLKIYDIITHFNGIKIDNENTLSKIIRTQNLNDEIKIKIIRDNEEMELIKTKK